MPSAAPPVTVLLPVHNGERWLAEAVESVLTQTFADFRLLLVDDASSDATPDIARSFDDERVVVVTSTENLGIAGALNLGLERISSRYVARMDADDVCLPDRLARQVAFLDEHAGIDVVGGQWVPIDGAGATLGGGPVLPTDPREVRWHLWFWNCVAHPTVLARREVLVTAGGYDPAVEPSDDYDLWLRLVASGRAVANLDVLVLRYRRHALAASLMAEGSAAERDTAVAARHLATITGRDVSPAAVRLLRAPRFGAPPDERVEAAAALGTLVRWARADRGARRTAIAVMARLVAGPGAARVVSAYRSGRLS